MSDDKSLSLIASLDIPKSTSQIKKDIKAIEKELKNSNFTIKASLDASGVKKGAEEVNKATSSIKIGELEKQVAKINKGIDGYYFNTKDIIGKIKKDFSSLGAVDVSNIFNDKGKISGFTASVTKANGTLEKYQYNLKRIQVGLTDKGNPKTKQAFVYSGGSGNDKNVGTNLNSTLNFFNKIDEKIANIQSKSLKQTNPLTSEMPQYDNYINKLNEVNSKIEVIKKSNNVLSNEHKREIGLMVNDLKNYSVEQKNAAYPPNKLASKSMSDNIKIETSNLDVLEQKWKTQGVLVGEFPSRVKSLREEINGISSAQGLINFKTNLKLTDDEAKKLKATLQSNKGTEKEAQAIENLSAQAQIGQNRVKSFGNELKTSAKNEYADRIKNISEAFEKVKTSSDPKDLQKANLTFREFQTEMKSMGLVGDSVLSKLGKNIKQFWSFMGSATLSMAAINAVRGVISTVVSLDTVLTDLRIATGITMKQSTQMMSEYIKMAKELGATPTEVANASLSWLKQGKTAQQAAELTKSSMVLSKVGAIESADATKYLTAVMKGNRKYSPCVQKCA